MTEWRGSLGRVMTQDFEVADAKAAARLEALRDAALAARQTERAARRLPYSPKCLPVAMALQWRLSEMALPSRLVIAMLRSDEGKGLAELDLASDDAFHAWVELEGAMLVGECERDDYRPVLGFQLPFLIA